MQLRILRSWIGEGGPKSSNWFLIRKRRGTLVHKTDTGEVMRRSHGDGGRDGRDAARSRGRPLATRSRKRRGRILPQGHGWECRLGNTLISNFCLQNSERTHSCCFKPPTCGNSLQQPREANGVALELIQFLHCFNSRQSPLGENLPCP